MEISYAWCIDDPRRSCYDMTLLKSNQTPSQKRSVCDDGYRAEKRGWKDPNAVRRMLKRCRR